MPGGSARNGFWYTLSVVLLAVAGVFIGASTLEKIGRVFRT